MFFGRELELINRRDRGEEFASAGVLPDYTVLGHCGHGGEEDGKGYGGAEGG